MGSLGFRHAKLDGFDCLVAEVFGLGSHFLMIAPRSMFMASAVELGSSTLNRGQAARSASSNHRGFLPRHLGNSAGGVGNVSNSSIVQR